MAVASAATSTPNVTPAAPSAAGLEFGEMSEEVEVAIALENRAMEELKASLRAFKRQIHDPRCADWASGAFLKSKTRELETLSDDLDLPGMSVVVVGNTGAGKSTLINSMLGESSLLPTNGMRACTAVLLQCAYDRTERGALYKGTVSFISKQDWQDTLEDLMGDLTRQDGRAVLHVSDPKAHNYQSWCTVVSVFGDKYKHK